MPAQHQVATSRRQTPHVIKGRVQKKHNHSFTPDYNYEAVEPNLVVVDRQRPGVGYRHVLTRDDVYRFLNLLPEWDEIAVELNAVVLAEGEDGTDGWHSRGVVAVCAWSTELWEEYSCEYYTAHQEIFSRLGIKTEELPDGYFRCEWTEPAVRAYQLLHILLHELGHHHDRMTTRRRQRTDRGETYAEDYALRHEALLWNAYMREFPEW